MSYCSASPTRRERRAKMFPLAHADDEKIKLKTTADELKTTTDVGPGGRSTLNRAQRTGSRPAYTRSGFAKTPDRPGAEPERAN